MIAFLFILCPLLALTPPEVPPEVSLETPPAVTLAVSPQAAPNDTSLDSLTMPLTTAWGAVGDEVDQWLVLPGLENTIGILHRHTTSPANTWQKIGTLKGKIHPHAQGLATHQGRLWIIFANRAVQSMTVRQLKSAPVTGPILVSKVHPNLPGQGTLQQMAVTTQGLYVLLQTEDRKLHLQVLQRTGWETRPLPTTLDPLGKTWLLTPSQPQENAWPTLIHLASNATLTIFERQEDHWQPSPFTKIFPTPKDHSFTPLHIMGQAVLCHWLDELSAELFLLRPPHILPLGVLEMSTESTGERQLLAMGSQIAMLQLDDKVIALTRTIDLQGRLSEKAMPLIIARSGPSLADPRRLVVAIAMAISILVMFGLWRRDPKIEDADGETGGGTGGAGGAGGATSGGAIETPQATLPPTMILAGFGKRAMALVIDLLPSMMIAAGLCDVRLRHLVDHWPGVGSDWSQMTPGLIAISIYIAHTTLTELFTARSLGKKIMGLHVYSLNGELPDVWQIFWRNLLKVLDLVAWYVLPILMLVSPYRQRLGDVVGKTIVVQHDPAAPPETPETPPVPPEPPSKNDPPESPS